VTAVLHTFENGTLGSNVGTGGGGSGTTAFDTVSRGTGATFIYDNTHVAHGTKAAKLATSTTTAAVYGEWNTAIGTQSEIYFRFNIYLTAAPPATWRFFRIGNASGACMELSMTTGRQIRILDQSTATLATLAGALPLNQWVRVEGHVVLAGSGGGSAEVRYYTSVDGTTATFSSTVSGANFRGAATLYRLGVTSSLASVPEFWIDDFAFDTVGWLGPADKAPTLTMPADRTEDVGELVSLTASASDPEGTSVSYAWSFVSKPTGSTALISGGTTATASFTLDLAGTYVLQCIATDGTGKATTGTVTVRDPSAAASNALVNVGGSLVPATMTVVP
jgi:hypothetical protein